MNKNRKNDWQEVPFFLTKEILSFQEALQYLDLSESSLYKLTSENKITFRKPNGGKLYFKKENLDYWMLQNESRSVLEIELEIAKNIGDGE